MPKVSICIPTYNNLEDVKRLLRSIEEQSFTDYEVNISDDSTNNEILEYVATKTYVRYQKNEKPLGHIFNWNAAIKMATGEYIKIMFSDDWFSFDYSLQTFVDMLDNNPKASLVFSGSRQTMLEEDADKLSRAAGDHRESFDRCAPKEYIEELKKDYRYLFISNQIGCPSATMYRRNADNSVIMFDEQSNWASDVFLYMDILKRESTFDYTSEPIISVGMHVEQYTETFGKNDLRIYNDYKYMYNKYDLCSEQVYREYFLKKYIIGFNQNSREARNARIALTDYCAEKLRDFFATIVKFIKNRF